MRIKLAAVLATILSVTPSVGNQAAVGRTGGDCGDYAECDFDGHKIRTSGFPWVPQPHNDCQQCIDQETGEPMFFGFCHQGYCDPPHLVAYQLIIQAANLRDLDRLLEFRKAYP